MYKTKLHNRNNVSGLVIAVLRKKIMPTMSQRALAGQLQLVGVDMDKNAVQRIESGERFVTDIELIGFAKVFHISVDELLICPGENG